MRMHIHPTITIFMDNPNTSGHMFSCNNIHDVYMTSYMHVAHAKAHDNEPTAVAALHHNFPVVSC